MTGSLPGADVMVVRPPPLFGNCGRLLRQKDRPPAQKPETISASRRRLVRFHGVLPAELVRFPGDWFRHRRLRPGRASERGSGAADRPGGGRRTGPPSAASPQPAKWPLLQNSEIDWAYRTMPQRHTANRVHEWARGRVIGGSTAINAMAHVRGHPSDFDRWAERRLHGLGLSQTCCPISSARDLRPGCFALSRRQRAPSI